MPLIPVFGDGKDEFPPEPANQSTLPQSETQSDTSIGIGIGIVDDIGPSQELAGIPVAPFSLPTHSRSYRVAKRLCDLALSILLLPLLSVLLVFIGVVVALTSGFPVFYRQHRLGQYGKTFRIFKFRTMRNNADQALAEWLLHHPEIRLEWERTHKLKRDPRITKLGRFLRDTSLDEIPQILNVLRGEMSLVGPRPIVQAERARYAERYVYYSEAVPGITGVWQVSGRCNVSYEERVRMDEDYVRHWSLLRDMKILLRTPRSVLRRDGAC